MGVEQQEAADAAIGAARGNINPAVDGFFEPQCLRA